MTKLIKKSVVIFSAIYVFMIGVSFASAKTVEEILQNLQNPLGVAYDGPADVSSLIGNVTKYVLSIVGTIAILFFIYGGFKWMTAEGKADQAAEAQKIMAWTAIGLAVIFSSYLIVSFVFGAI